MKQMRVLLISDADDQYGAPRAMLELALELKNKYEIHPIILTCSNSSINKFCDKNSIENYVTYHRSCMVDNYHHSLRKSIKDLLRFMRYIICKKVSLILVRKHIDFKSIDLIHSNSNRIDFGVLLSKKYRIPHVMHFREEAGGCKPFFKTIYKDIDDQSYYLIAISNTVKLGWIKYGLPENKFVTVYDGIDVSDIEIKNYSNDDDIFRIVCVGSLFENKGQHIIMKAISILPKEIKNKVIFDMYGEGEFYNELRKIKDELCLNNVSFKGYSNSIHKILKDYDCGIVASKKEGFGRTTVEYMAAGLCVIAANSGATIEITKDRYNALIFNREDTQELADKIEELFINRDLRKQLALNGQKMVQSIYTKEKNAAEVMKLYERIID